MGQVLIRKIRLFLTKPTLTMRVIDQHNYRRRKRGGSTSRENIRHHNNNDDAN